jgi:ATP-dependent Clp protease adaptor protein ClpS
MIDDPLITTKPKIEFLVAEELEPPYRVLIHNDDVTPMDFVVEILLTYFDLAGEQAIEVMLTAHNNGIALVGAWSRDQALWRIDQAHQRARANNYPLKFTAEPESG